MPKIAATNLNVIVSSVGEPAARAIEIVREVGNAAEEEGNASKPHKGGADRTRPTSRPH
jgi:hypothetical protein